MKISAEAFAQAGYPLLGTPYSKMDCQAFVERCMGRVGVNADLPGSNAWYRAMTWTGTPEECKRRFGRIPNGALLFILKNDGGEPAKYRGDGIGNASHIGIKTGRSKGAIHSSASRGCVAESEFHDKTVPNGGWNRVGLDTRFDYGADVNRLLTGGDGPETPAERGDAMYRAEVTTKEGILNVRKGPGKNYTRIGAIPKGEIVDVFEEENGWAKINDDGLSGYVSLEFLTRVDGVHEDGAHEDAPEPETGMEWYVHIPCASQNQAEALADLIPGAIACAYNSGGDSID